MSPLGEKRTGPQANPVLKQGQEEALLVSPERGILRQELLQYFFTVERKENIISTLLLHERDTVHLCRKCTSGGPVENNALVEDPVKNNALVDGPIKKASSSKTRSRRSTSKTCYTATNRKPNAPCLC